MEQTLALHTRIVRYIIDTAHIHSHTPSCIATTIMTNVTRLSTHVRSLRARSSQYTDIHTLSPFFVVVDFHFKAFSANIHTHKYIHHVARTPRIFHVQFMFNS